MKHTIIFLITMALLPFPVHAAVDLLLSDVEEAVSHALSEEDIADFIKATTTSTRKKILYSGQNGAAVEINNLTYDEKTLTWSANMLVVKDEKVLTAQPLSGRYAEQRQLPVLKRRIKKGEVISQENITMQLFPTTRIRDNTVTDVKELIGKTPERMISKHRAIRASEVSHPAVMDKGSTVQMRYQTPYMQISTIGEAMEDGSMGEYIRVRNNDSNQIIRARVVSNNAVIAGGMER